MKSVLLALLLASPAALAERRWTVEAGQALVSVEAGRFTAFSHGITGTLVELDNGLSRLELHLPLATLTTGNAALDEQAVRQGEAVFEGVAEGHDGALNFIGTLRLRGVSRPVALTISVSRTDSMLFAHASSTLRLRDFGIPLATDQARFQLDAGLRKQGVLASRE